MIITFVLKTFDNKIDLLFCSIGKANLEAL